MNDTDNNKDLKGGIEQPSGNDQPENANTDNSGGDEETIAVKKSEYDKAMSDLDNYRQSLLKYRSLEKEQKKNNDNEEGEKVEKQNSEIDENKLKELAKSEASSVMNDLYKSNENRAKNTFFQRYPEYVDENVWADLLSYASFKRGKASPEDVIEDLEDAVLIHKRNTGKLDEFIKSEREKAKFEGKVEGQFQSAGEAGNAGDHNNAGSSNKMTPEQEELSRRLGNDPEKVKGVDYKEDRTIDIFKSNKNEK